MSEQQRSDLLEQNLMAAAASGARVQARTPTQAVLVRGKPVNHVLHVILTLLFCGWWGPVWLLIAALGGEKRSTLTATPAGQVVEEKAPMETHQVVLLVIAAVWLVLMFIFFATFVGTVFSS